jgi:hypothetical protein
MYLKGSILKKHCEEQRERWREVGVEKRARGREREGEGRE